MPAAPRPENPLRPLLVAQLHALLAQLAERPELRALFDTAAVVDEYTEAYLVVGPVPRGPQLHQPGQAPLKALERRILEVCTPQPQSAKRIAGRLNRPCNSYFRGLLTALCRRAPPLLTRTPDGYRLPD